MGYIFYCNDKYFMLRYNHHTKGVDKIMMKLIKKIDKFHSELLYLLLIFSFTFTYSITFIFPQRFIENVIENNNLVIKSIMTIGLLSMYVICVFMFIDKYKSLKIKSSEVKNEI